LLIHLREGVGEVGKIGNGVRKVFERRVGGLGVSFYDEEWGRGLPPSFNISIRDAISCIYSIASWAISPESIMVY
jgi:hypothetical protein